jgi:hypothetical protein
MSNRKAVEDILAKFNQRSAITLHGYKKRKKVPFGLLLDYGSLSNCCGSLTVGHSLEVYQKINRILGVTEDPDTIWGPDKVPPKLYPPEDVTKDAEKVVVTLEDTDCKLHIMYWNG